MKFKHMFAEPKPNEPLHEFLAREHAAWKLRFDELKLAESEGCGCDVDVEQRLRDKGLIDGAVTA